MSKPYCVIVTGRPGSGKTTLAMKLSDILHMPVFSRDRIKEGYVRTSGVSHENLPAETNRKVTNLFFAVAQEFLKGNVSIIVEAAFQHKLWNEVIEDWSKLGRVNIIICELDATLSARRHLDRGLKDPTREYYHGDTRVRTYRETGDILGPGEYEPPSFNLPTLRVYTQDGYDPDLSQIESFIFPTEAQPSRAANLAPLDG